VKTLTNAIKLILIAFVLVLVVSSIWHRVHSAQVTDQNGVAINYRAYRSVWGNLYLEDEYRVTTIIYPRSLAAIDADSSVPIYHSDSWIVLNPVRSLIPTDKPLSLSHNPRLEVGERQISLNVFEKQRITIRF